MQRLRAPAAKRLPFVPLLALRYLKSSRRDAYVSFLAMLAAGGITLGVAALILVLSALAGLQGFLRRDVLARTPHLEIELPEGAAAEALRDELSSVDGVLEARRLLRGRGWLLVEGRVIAVRLVGFEGKLPSFFPGGIGEGEGLYLGRHLAASWGLEAGKPVELVSPRPTLTPFGPQPRIRRLRVAGTYEVGRTENEEQRVALPLAVARGLLGDRQMRLELRTADLDSALEVASTVRPLLPEGSRLRTWKDLNRALFFTLRLERTLMFVSVFLIVPVAAMALVTVLVLLIASKRSEIGMLQAMGASPEELRRIFLLLGSMIATMGLVAGGTLGILGAWLCDKYRLISPPGDVYYLSHVPFDIEPGSLLVITVATLAMTLASTLYAARRASELEAVEALRA